MNMKKLYAVLIVFFLTVCLSACGDSIRITSSSDSMVGKNYEDVINELNQMGFSKIEKVEISDLTSDSPMEDGAVESITIDGKSSFKENEFFSKDASIEVKYHIVKRLNSPLSADKIATMDVSEISDEYTKAGFINVKTEEIYDIDPEVSNEDHRNEVIISDKTVVSESDSFKFDADVRVICHYPYEKYDAKLIIEFVSNLIFSKYDVVLKIDGAVVETLPHGKDYNTTIKLQKGTHELVFCSSDDEKVEGKIDLDISSNLEVSYKINCYNDHVGIETIYVDQQTELADDEVKILDGMASYKSRDYKDVKKELSDAGFTNIKEKPLYDIVFGWTNEGEVESVSIGGKEDYKRGDVYKKDAEVLVSYHLFEKDDPNNKVESTNAEQEKHNDSDDELYNAIYTAIVDKDLIEGKKYLTEMGYVVELTHEVTKLDFTKELSIYSDDEIKDQGWIITGISDFDSASKNINVFINTTENKERIDEENKTKEALEQNFDPSIAVSALEQYGKEQYPYGFKLHQITGMLAETAVDENTWFMKYSCQVKDEYGNKHEMTCEGKIKGPESNPTVYDFIVY